MKLKVEGGKCRTGSGKWKTFHFPISVFHFLVLVLLVSSCTSHKKLASMAHVADYEWVTAKMSGEVKVESGEIPFSGTLRMRRDSVIWISANGLMGMEALRTRITSDSVILINRMDKTYLAEPLDEAATSLQLPLTLQETQTLLLGDGKSDKVSLQWGPYTAKIRYSDLHWDEPTSFPIKISPNYERMKL